MQDAKQLQTLLFACSHRDRAAFTRLYNLTSANLFAVAIRILKKQSLAEDVLQDAYISIWNKASEFSHTKGSVMAWMSSIVRYRAFDVLRKQKRTVVYEDAENEIEHLPELDMSLLDTETALALRECLSMLNKEQRNSLMLSFYEGLTHGELAERLAKPLGTIKSWIRRSLLQVRKCLEQ